MIFNNSREELGRLKVFMLLFLLSFGGIITIPGFGWIGLGGMISFFLLGMIEAVQLYD